MSLAPGTFVGHYEISPGEWRQVTDFADRAKGDADIVLLEGLLNHERR